MIRIPANYDNSHPYPLVFAFHWNGGNMNDVDGGGSSGYTWSYFGLREQADNSTNSKMIFVAPDGNGGWPNSNGQDLTFVDDMLKLIQGDLCVDTTGQRSSRSTSRGRYLSDPDSLRGRMYLM
jgi:hypothetical protein